MAKRDRTLLVETYARSKSFTTAITSLRFAIEYGRMCDELGRDDVPITEYGEHVGISRAQAFRRQGAYRTCFPKQDVLQLWRDVIRPNLDASNFKNAKSYPQAVFASSLKAKWE